MPIQPPWPRFFACYRDRDQPQASWTPIDVYLEDVNRYGVVGDDDILAAWRKFQTYWDINSSGWDSCDVSLIDGTSGNPVTRLDVDLALCPEGSERKSMIKLNIKREGGRLYLHVNAKGLHEILDSIGVPVDGALGMYKDRPRAAVAVAERGSHTMSTEVLLRKEYPAKYDLSTVYTDPPSMQNLQKLTESGYEQARKILEHYQPIDISVTIQKKEK